MLSTIEGKICALILLVFVSPVNGRQKMQGWIKVQLWTLVFFYPTAFRGRPLPVNVSYIQVVVLTRRPQARKPLAICVPPFHSLIP